MDEQNKTPREEKPKTEWQKTKEGWYDHVPLTLKQLDLIIYGCIGALIAIFVYLILNSGVLG